MKTSTAILNLLRVYNLDIGNRGSSDYDTYDISVSKVPPEFQATYFEHSLDLGLSV